MKKVILALSLIFSIQSEARSKEAGFFASLGVGYDALTIENSGHKSNFSGWSPALGFGGILPMGANWSVIGGVEIKDLQVKNQSESDQFLETLEGSSVSAHLALQLGDLGFGAYASQDHFEVKQVSAGGASVMTKIKGDANGYFVNYSLQPKDDYKITFESGYGSGKANKTYDYSDLAFAMKFAFLF